MMHFLRTDVPCSQHTGPKCSTTIGNGKGMGDGHASSADRKRTRLNSSHSHISYAVFCFKKKIKNLILAGVLVARQARSQHNEMLSAMAKRRRTQKSPLAQPAAVHVGTRTEPEGTYLRA